MIDIDPGTNSTFDDVLVAARLDRAALDHFGVVGCPKVTGKRGVQIWVPVARGYTFADTRDFVEGISRAIGQTIPELVAAKILATRPHLKTKPLPPSLPIQGSHAELLWPAITDDDEPCRFLRAKIREIVRTAGVVKARAIR